MGSHSLAGHPAQAVTPARQADTRFSYSGVMEGWVDLGDWLHTEMAYPPTDGHQSKYEHGSARLGIEPPTCWLQVQRHHQEIILYGVTLHVFIFTRRGFQKLIQCEIYFTAADMIVRLLKSIRELLKRYGAIVKCVSQSLTSQLHNTLTNMKICR